MQDIRIAPHGSAVAMRESLLIIAAAAIITVLIQLKFIRFVKFN